MDRKRFHTLERALCAAGVATRHARRAVAEINAHHAQHVDAARSAGKSAAEAIAEADGLIGDEQMLVERFASRPELRAFSHRRPLLAFSILPLFGLLLAAVGLFAAVAALPGVVHFEIPGPGVLYSVTTIKALTLWAGPVAISAWCTWLAWRHRIALRWPTITAVLVCALGMIVEMNATYEGSGPTPIGTLQFGLGFPPPPDQFVRGIITFMIALVPLTMLARIEVARRRPAAIS
jgi:hypothetical protein